MSDTILKASHISKQYRLGLVGTGTMSDDLKRWWHRLRGKDDPFLQVGDVNDRSTKATSNYVWALQDINFEVKRGEVLGIIGKNGAGKSTLLKILSRVTGPTTGEIKTRGRIASLLEVGTGFHPELTGRENIYLNGAILGMTKTEIRAKEEEIIEFSGCERYVDTPVKRYSSGMRVRLAFAVAAFLEPDILVIDEVLAVGDAEFQKKAVGKMQDISKGEGRTVLFVSHNMAAVKSLCTRAIVLEHGKVVFEGNQDDAVEFYLNSNYQKGSSQKSYYFDKNEFEDVTFSIKHIGIHGFSKDYESPINRKDSVIISIDIEKSENDKIVIVYIFKDSSGQKIFVTNSNLDGQNIAYIGSKKIIMRIPSLFFNEGVFAIDIMITDGKKLLFNSNDVLKFVILEEEKVLGEWMGKSPGFLKPRFSWEF
ncbi:lipopolysaccharide transport system ATP-binding protein [Formosa sp. Hel1_31_208]|uniref:ABC transporter ATP-binding protein n=1 Tax=Formosa sp. Hel1_31_208 TaxID=1798225 RepID=UPI00087BE4FA|nr:ABC transporter ATP-binding protein [Formosa sp. Hel1_31_208]SDS69519.1 lipopolysaccharide transport system ATP-binding protein [Formosa sp. Hel1_31_208]